MIKHVVMWKMKEEALGKSGAENAEKMVKELLDLEDKIKELVYVEAGTDFVRSGRSFDVALFAQFKTKEDLDTYAVHPEHLKVVEFIKSVTKESVAVDFEI